jgi:hypothetical protein
MHNKRPREHLEVLGDQQPPRRDWKGSCGCGEQPPTTLDQLPDTAGQRCFYHLLIGSSLPWRLHHLFALPNLCRGDLCRYIDWYLLSAPLVGAIEPWSLIQQKAPQ